MMRCFEVTRRGRCLESGWLGTSVRLPGRLHFFQRASEVSLDEGKQDADSEQHVNRQHHVHEMGVVYVAGVRRIQYVGKPGEEHHVYAEDERVQKRRAHVATKERQATHEIQGESQQEAAPVLPLHQHAPCAARYVQLCDVAHSNHQGPHINLPWKIDRHVYASGETVRGVVEEGTHLASILLQCLRNGNGVARGRLPHRLESQRQSQ
mmetsp:Transcript_62509/g.174234  ORF Transcript_62509/g.174234 Transcript_62509/m.174234 type:complete len:208 (+) Transcript_62509:566-1189(+)